MSKRYQCVDETILQPPKYTVSKETPKGNPDPRIVADLKKKLEKK
ncbi:MAG TPA: hypothetical protein O0X42_03190 [Methanocorpusculum sp.]|nr:hypothetical protein [Methanocorpusculum sp.]